ncbi:MAG: XdhC family protein [Bacteroidales bacterium]|nr:XdhC family protein [Lentimicrobiaceae bacterium]MDD5696155.1 XdhC family protein [Bacteroidales bacterium]
MNNLFLRIPDCYKDTRASAICIVTEISGSVPGKAGAKMIVYSDGSIEGTVGGGAIEMKVIKDALSTMKKGIPGLMGYDLETDAMMSCGGRMTVYIEPLTKPVKLFIFGAGHIGKYLAGYAPDMGFETTLIDWRKEAFNDPQARYSHICKSYLETIEDITFDTDTFFVIVTPNHEMDEDVLAAIGKKPAAYIGLIGSKRKIDSLTHRFLEENILTQEELNKVDMPIGIKFKAITPQEIAISILAKIIDVKNNTLQE